VWVLFQATKRELSCLLSRVACSNNVNCFQEGTQALRELLQIGEKPGEKKQDKPETSVRGRQLSLDELFRSQSK